jgi:sterol desaturase/sphingolipid hydroxylase (fatty acid hydroxylase superfamily)
VTWRHIESIAYWLLFVAAFLSVAAWETRRPERDLMVPAGRRWGKHAILLAVGAVCTTLVLRATPVAFAAAAAGFARPGVLSALSLNKPGLPWWVSGMGAILLLDLAKYATHRMFHAVPWLWRVHQVHHSDPDFDVSTATRAHPIEAVATQASALLVIFLLLLPPGAVLAAELLALALSFFEHANASLPRKFEKYVRNVLITPDVHRIHHSARIAEQLRNYGEIFPWWDRLFGTYLASPERDGGFRVGLKGLEGPRTLGIGFMLAEPFQRPPAADSD